MTRPVRRPRALTLTLPDYLVPHLVLDGKPHLLRNFSEEGMGVWMPTPAPYGLAKGSTVSGDVVMGSQIHPVQLEVMYITHGVVGLKILHRSVELGDIFRRMLEPTAYAMNLAAHPESATVDASIGYPRLWYHTRGAELLVWFDPKARTTLGIQLRWLGQWVFRERLHPPQTGYMMDFAHGGDGAKVKPADLLIAHNPAEKELLQRAGQFLAAVPAPLPGYLFWQFLENGMPLELPAGLLVPAEKKAS